MPFVTVSGTKNIRGKVMEYENVREALKLLIEVNDSKLNSNLKTKNIDGKWSISTVKDIQDMNQEALISIADQLGMSDLYLE